MSSELGRTRSHITLIIRGMSRLPVVMPAGPSQRGVSTPRARVLVREAKWPPILNLYNAAQRHPPFHARYSKRSVRWRSVCHQSRWFRYQSTVAAMPSRAVWSGCHSSSRLREGGIDRVTAIVAEAIGDEGDQAVRLAELVEDQPNDIEVHHLAVAADVVDRARLALEERGDERGAVVFHVDPVAHVHPVAVDRERLVAERLDDHERDQFFRELVGAVVVRAAGDDDFLAEGAMAGEGEEVGAGFARGIGASWARAAIAR